MDRFERIYQLHHILSERRTPASNRFLQDKLECSDATVKRLVGLMRDHFDAPIVYDRNRNGYYYDTETGAHPYELPGLWFNAEELWGLLTCHTMLRKISPGIFGDQIAQLQNRIEKLLALDQSSAERKLECIKIIPIASRQNVQNPWFAKIAGALFDNQRLDLIYEARSDGHTSERSVSPQNLVYYRDNWYLDAWCHLRNKLRTFALERIKTAIRQEVPAQSVDRQQLEDYFSAAYGIFSGNAEHIAKLKFTPQRARWVADEQWHPKQTGRLHKDGSYELHVPFGDHRELLMDILRHGAEVEILEPAFLRDALIEQIEAMASIYQKN
ncbi:MAG: YafY family protein [Methylicorpusculum sp.]|uniref:helix-turn-helix transcriptional regulator n=1 Tax=Methylicorpusculum sp. TaxID=2713644 RepID=UPI002727D83F|nr:YafY family protein [Methylicorpusculum sp.]MDO8939535.1 YafY family protein [Methylicorpusculum sp.]MDP2204561.1 YafY family protein [Methylicorpusculum sp.]